MHKLYVILFFFGTLNIFSQKEANIWYFGENAGIDFNTCPPTAITDGLLNTTEGCSSFSDSEGNLLFYSDGISVYNKDHQLMNYTNGNLANNLRGNPSSTQSGMIIPKPGSSSIFYLFTVGTNFTDLFGIPNPGFNYYTIDMSLNNNLGEIIAGPINLAIDPLTGLDLSELWSEKVTAVKGKEFNTFWVLSFVGDTFYAYKVGINGLDLANVVTSRVNFTSNDKRGYLQVSPNGKKIAFADYNLFEDEFETLFVNGSLVLFDFNDETGAVDPTSMKRIISDNDNQSPYGVAFSQQSNKLYASTFNGDFSIFQFDLESNDIANSRKNIITKDGFRGALQLGPDGKIYASIPDNEYLDAIENPNEDADNIIYTENALFLNGRTTQQGLPPFISSLLLPLNITEDRNNQNISNQDLKYCIGENISFETEKITGTNITYSWSFNNGITTSVFNNNSDKLELKNLSETNNGTYSIIVTSIDKCGNNRILETSFTISVFEPAIVSTKPSDINLCSINNINTFDLQSDVSPLILGSLDPNQFEVLFFLTENDANQNSIIALPNPYELSGFTSQNIYARIHNIDAPFACFDITNFNLSVFNIPQPTQPTDYIVCDDINSGSDTDGLSGFLLSTKDQEILGSLDNSLFNISYHTTLTGAQTDNKTDSIDKNLPYTNTSSNQTIYIRIENSNNIDCFVSSEENSTTFSPFSLIVAPLPVINKNTQLIQCDTNTTSSVIDLTLAEINISDNNTNETFKYFPTENDAIRNTFEITNQTSYDFNNNDVVWVKIISTEGCYRISELHLIISFTGTIPYNETFITCDDEFDTNGNDSDSDGVSTFDLSKVSVEVLKSFPSNIHNDLNIFIFESEEDREILKNQIPFNNISNYRNTNLPALTSQNLYYKVTNKTNNQCEGLGEISIKTNPLPTFDVITPQIVCLNNLPLTIEAENPNPLESYTYQWTNDQGIKISPIKSLNITTGGNYHITATNNTTQCQRSKTINVQESNIATFSEENITITDDNQNNSITIDTNIGNGNYEYALFNEDETETVRNYQDEPLFENLEGGIYTIAIQDKNNCGITTLVVSVIEFPKFLTPNNDGYNDTWNIKGVNATFFPNSFIYIFDRFGKQLAEIPIDNEGWDGTLNGKQLPPNDYWYSIQLIDNEGNIRNKKGHFSLVRN